jgi:hypothetical protein
MTAPRRVCSPQTFSGQFVSAFTFARIRDSSRAGVVLLTLVGAAACAHPDDAAHCTGLGGTYNASATPSCSFPVDEAQTCAAVGGTYSASATPKCALPTKPLDCVEAASSGSQSCNDAGGFASTCAVAACPSGYKLTGGGGICAAGNRKLKGLNPRLATNEFFIMCEQQGVPPQARALCCK